MPSEEIATADANVAHIARLREQLNYEQLRAEEAERALAAAKEVIARAYDVRGCVEIDSVPEDGSIQLRGYRKPVVVAGWTATQIHRLLRALATYEAASKGAER